jgi:hypothetical protein
MEVPVSGPGRGAVGIEELRAGRGPLPRSGAASERQGRMRSCPAPMAPSSISGRPTTARLAAVSRLP